ncbi:unnamed protein product [Tuber aestivum]|uniref:Uncharacterized protein n=1 Tax=Tuber aestivum TaxID=59557 RepID=A0A292PWB3_9PEZI|nr:unnamed protein product [Tuber aestivum]
METRTAKLVPGFAIVFDSPFKLTNEGWGVGDIVMWKPTMVTWELGLDPVCCCGAYPYFPDAHQKYTQQSSPLKRSLTLVEAIRGKGREVTIVVEMGVESCSFSTPSGISSRRNEAELARLAAEVYKSWLASLAGPYGE